MLMLLLTELFGPIQTFSPMAADPPIMQQATIVEPAPQHAECAKCTRLSMIVPAPTYVNSPRRPRSTHVAEPTCAPSSIHTPPTWATTWRFDPAPTTSKPSPPMTALAFTCASRPMYVFGASTTP